MLLWHAKATNNTVQHSKIKIDEIFVHATFDPGNLYSLAHSREQGYEALEIHNMVLYVEEAR
jgi:hypothetical protein